MDPSIGSPEQLEEWIKAVLAGNREAYAPIVAAYQHQIWAVMAGYCRSEEEIEEFCHLAFVEAYFRLAQYSPERGSFLSWLMTIARSRLLNEIQRRKAEGERFVRALERSATQGPPYPLMDRARSALQRCLESLEPEEAELVRSRYFARQTSEQVGARTGRSAVAVRRFLQRVRERLRQCIEARLAMEEA